MRQQAVAIRKRKIKETDNHELHEHQQQPHQHQPSPPSSTSVQQAPMTAMLMPHAPTWLMGIHALATAAFREMVSAVLISMSAQMAATTVTLTHSAKIQLAHSSASATQATLETGSLAVISMNALVATHAQITPPVQIPRVIFHVPVTLDTKATEWSEVKEADVKISMSAKLVTTVTKTPPVMTQMVVSNVLATQDMKEAVPLAARLTSVSLVPIIVMLTQHASQPLVDSNEARSDQDLDHLFANVTTGMKAMATHAPK
jgi:DNA-binding TFAR19-related protein (PDSD5 family)